MSWIRLFDFTKKVLELSSEHFGCIRNLPIYICTDGEIAHLLENVEISYDGCILLLKSNKETSLDEALEDIWVKNNTNEDTEDDNDDSSRIL